MRDVTLTARNVSGREEHLAAIVRLLDNSAHLPGVAVLVGEAGIGKTTLWLAGMDAGNCWASDSTRDSPARP